MKLESLVFVWKLCVCQERKVCEYDSGRGTISTLPSAITPLLYSPLQKHSEIDHFPGPLQSDSASVVGWIIATQRYQLKPVEVTLQGKRVFADVIKIRILRCRDYTGLTGEGGSKSSHISLPVRRRGIWYTQKRKQCRDRGRDGSGATTSKWTPATRRSNSDIQSQRGLLTP